MEKRFSIIIPAYNVGDYIENSINSVLSQTFSNYELIVINDCSTDNGETINKIQQFPNITILNTPKNSGAGGARNFGISHAQGEYILFLDSDDTLHSSETLFKLDSLIGSDSPDIIYQGFQFIGGEDFSFIPNEENSEKNFRLGTNKFINVWSITWKRQFILEHHLTFNENVIYEDVPFAFAGISLATSYKFAPFITHNYTRQRPNSISVKDAPASKHFKQSKDTISCIESLCLLKNIISDEDVPFLIKRLKEQKVRLIARLDRGIDKLI